MSHSTPAASGVYHPGVDQAVEPGAPGAGDRFLPLCQLHAGLSCGKYRAFLELQRLDPDATVEEVRGMTMGELLRRIESLSPEGEASPWPGNGRGHAHHSHRED